MAENPVPSLRFRIKAPTPTIFCLSDEYTLQVEASLLSAHRKHVWEACCGCSDFSHSPKGVPQRPQATV